MLARMEKEIVLRRLEHCELQFKLALAINLTCIGAAKNSMNYLTTFSYGEHNMDTKELSLSTEEEKLGAAILEHSATYIMILQLNEVLKKTFPEWYGKNKLFRDDVEIVRLIRNAFAHDPLSPTWDIPKNLRNRILNVNSIITLNTKNLQGKELKHRDYGGPISLLRLLQHFKPLLKERLN